MMMMLMKIHICFCAVVSIFFAITVSLLLLLLLLLLWFPYWPMATNYSFSCYYNYYYYYHYNKWDFFWFICLCLMKTNSTSTLMNFLLGFPCWYSLTGNELDWIPSPFPWPRRWCWWRQGSLQHTPGSRVELGYAVFLLGHCFTGNPRLSPFDVPKCIIMDTSQFLFFVRKTTFDASSECATGLTSGWLTFLFKFSPISISELSSGGGGKRNVSLQILSSRKTKNKEKKVQTREKQIGNV